MSNIDNFYKGNYLATIVCADHERNKAGEYEFVDLGLIGLSTSYEETMALIWGDAVDLVEVGSEGHLDVSFEETVSGDLETRVLYGEDHSEMRIYYMLFHKRPDNA